MLVSVEIVSRCKLVFIKYRKSRLFTIGCGIVAGTVETGSPFQMPPELQDQPFVCSIGKSQNGPFQDCPCNIIKKKKHRPPAC